MKILITGGCGFLGSNLASDTIQNGHELMIFDNLSRMGTALNLDWLHNQGKLIFNHGDIRSANDINKAIVKFKPDAIFHLAGQVAMTTSIENPIKDFEINAMGSINVLESVRQHCPEAMVIYSSTNKVYGDLEQFNYVEMPTRFTCKEHPKGFSEDIPLDFHSPYGCSKGAADQYMLDYARIFGLRTAVFRHSSMYGGRQFSSFDQGWIGWFCQQGLEQKNRLGSEPFTISGNGKQVRDLLHAEDMKKLYQLSVKNFDAISGKAFNIGGGEKNSLSLLELFEILEEELEIKLDYINLPPRESDQKVFIANHEKITSSVGWVPQVSSRSGVKLMLEWIKSNKSFSNN
jgi:CDP-paratose 2-epimerase